MTHQPPNPLNLEGVGFCTKLWYNVLMNILQKIFKEHYEEIIYILHPRQAIVENIDRIINCGDPSFGGATLSPTLLAMTH